MNSSQPGHLLEILDGEEKINMQETNKIGLSEMVVLLVSIGFKFFVSNLDRKMIFFLFWRLECGNERFCFKYC